MDHRTVRHHLRNEWRWRRYSACDLSRRRKKHNGKVYSGSWTYISEVQSHSEFGRDTEDDTETDTEEQSEHGGIVIGAEVAGDEDSCPYSDSDDDDG